MRKLLGFVLIVVLVAAVSRFVFAQETKDSMPDKKAMKAAMADKETMMARHGKMTAMCPMHGMMAKMMMQREMVAAKDGGVIVMSGNRLLKYDRNLNLKKEIELKIDMADMKKMMADMMEKCPMRKMMMDKGIISQEDLQESEEAAGTTVGPGHQEHH
jgi:hypothetical protein